MHGLASMVAAAQTPAAPTADAEVVASKTAARGTRRQLPIGLARLKARYDAAINTAENLRNFANADGLDANAAASPDVRAILRKRGRHELENNPYTDGMHSTLAGDVIGRGPRLRMQTENKTVNSLIEREVATWLRRIRVAKKLRQIVETESAQGEIFGLTFTNNRLPTPVKVDLRLYEGDQVATPDIWFPDNGDRVDGIEFDNIGNPIFYHFLKRHPGDNRWPPVAGAYDYDRIPADRVIHIFRSRRPGATRGIPRITSSLTLFPQRRSFRQSTLTAAAVAAQMGAALIESDADPDADELVQEFTSLELEHGMMTALPAGYKAKQMEAEQPTTTFAEFDNKLIAESARPLNMPRNIAMCDSSEYNYASGRLDHQTYDRSIDVDHETIEIEVLDRLLEKWLEEALTIPGYLPARARSLLRDGIPHNWLWRKRPHVDPIKEANAQKVRLESGVTTISREIADDAMDLEDHFEELKKEIEMYRDLGLVHPAERANPKNKGGQEPNDANDVPDDEDDMPARRNGSRNGSANRNGSRATNRIGGLT